MRKNFLLTACVAMAIAAASVGTANAQNANLITNGDFSNGLTGWTQPTNGTATYSTVGAYGTSYAAANTGVTFTDASTFAVLPYNTSPTSSLTVTFNTVAGTKYNMSFVSGTFADPVLGSGEYLNYTVSIAGEGVVNSGSTLGGQDTDFVDLFSPLPTSIFTGNGEQATIAFTSADNGANTNPGAAILLTDVVVQDVPEPSSFALALTGIVGLAGLGFARSRSRKSI